MGTPPRCCRDASMEPERCGSLCARDRGLDVVLGSIHRPRPQPRNRWLLCLQPTVACLSMLVKGKGVAGLNSARRPTH